MTIAGKFCAFDEIAGESIRNQSKESGILLANMINNRVDSPSNGDETGSIESFFVGRSGKMEIIVQGLLGLLNLASLVCFILVLIQMFQRGQTGLGIACIVLICCGIGGLVAFIYGWMKSNEWGIKNLMLAWAGLIVLAIIVDLAGLVSGAITIP